jgi:predicted aconitase
MLELNERDSATLNGEFGPGAAIAMRIVTQSAKVMSAQRLIDVTGAHIDGCVYHGAVSLHFVEKFVESGAKVSIPTTLNVGSLDLIHPELYSGDRAVGHDAKRLMDAHVLLGCQPTFTCAPYQLKQRPSKGEQIAWAESNAIVFANSVLGACTDRYGDFLDLAAAVTGRVPYAGLHVEANRAAQIVFSVPDFADFPGRDIYFSTLGALIGAEVGVRIPAIVGLPDDTTEDELKALGSGAAATGAVGLFHAVGITPEAPTLAAALQGKQPERTVSVSIESLGEARRRLSDVPVGSALTAVALGTPHYSLAEFDNLVRLLSRHSGSLKCDFYVNTSRFNLPILEENGVAARLRELGIQVVVDTCTYFTPVMRNLSGMVMTNSAKWANYAPMNIGVAVAFGSTEECVQSAFRGKVWYDDGSN